jgi:hypothetical protein
MVTGAQLLRTGQTAHRTEPGLISGLRPDRRLSGNCLLVNSCRRPSWNGFAREGAAVGGRRAT